MQIRRHIPGDFTQLARLRWLLKMGDHNSEPSSEQSAFTRDYCDQLRASEALGDTVHFVVEDQSRLLGAVTIRVVRKELSPGAKPDAWGYVTNTFVLAEHRQRGVGTALLNGAIAWAADSGLELLIVWPSERSVSFYRRAGFEGQTAPLERIL